METIALVRGVEALNILRGLEGAAAFQYNSVFDDRFVLSLINKKIINAKGFYRKENGAVIMEDETRKIVIKAWQERKQDKIIHPYLNEKIPWGLVPYAQALLLARHIRRDLDE
jgi:CRISPR-associated protein Cas1